MIQLFLKFVKSFKLFVHYFRFSVNTTTLSLASSFKIFMPFIYFFLLFWLESLVWC